MISRARHAAAEAKDPSSIQWPDEELRASNAGGTTLHPVLPGSVDAHPQITQRDLRSRSREIMDAVEHGQSFIVTRDGHRIGELIPPPPVRPAGGVLGDVAQCSCG